MLREKDGSCIIVVAFVVQLFFTSLYFQGSYSIGLSRARYLTMLTFTFGSHWFE